jgi:hypothetical protein
VSYGPSASSKFITTYFRRSFEATGSYSALALRLVVDDGAVVYLNGAELLRVNMPAGAVASATRAYDTPCETCWTEYALPAGALRAGTNVIAVEVHQSSPSSSDLSFDLELVGAADGAADAGTPDVGGQSPPASGLPTTTRTFGPSADDIANPERGFMRQVSVWPDATTSLDGIASRRAATDTLVWIYFRLDNYRTRPLDGAALSRISSAFGVARAAGLKVVARFLYNFPTSYSSNPADWAPDATLGQVLQHVEALRPVLAADADVLATLQAGFVGLWGEWHSSKNGLTTPANEKAILDALLAATPADRTLQARYPVDKQTAYGGPLTEAEAFSGTPRARIGHHNDCFLASTDDEGTYRDDPYVTPSAATIARWKDFISQEGRFTPVGGETCAVNPPRSECATALAELESLRWSFLNNGFDAEVLDSWTRGGCMDTIRRRLGHRVLLTDATLPSSIAPGSAFDVTFRVRNDGFGALYNPRPVLFVLDGPAGSYGVELPRVDPRRWSPGTTALVSSRVRLPAEIAVGSYRASLWLPDAARRLRDVPAYAVRFANAGTWDASLGRNVLTSAFAVDSGGPTFADSDAPEMTRLP